MNLLFKPLFINKNLTLKNRIVMAPMATRYATSIGEVTPEMVKYYAERARGGVGLIIAEGAYISEEGKGWGNQLGIYSDNLIPGLKYLAKRIKEEGARVAIQIHHAGRQTTSKIAGKKIIAPSPIPCPVMEEEPQALRLFEIKETIKKFALSTKRAKEAGFDAVEIQGAHGYLINQFVSPYSNKRNDIYGGSLENRLRFSLEVVEEIRKVVGEEYPVFYRISAKEYVEGGLDLEETKILSKELERKGLDVIDVSVGVYEFFAKKKGNFPTKDEKEGELIPLAEEIKKVLKKTLVIAVGRLNNPSLAEKVLKERKADLIALGRALLADPNWCNKVRTNKEKEIIKCKTCTNCQYHSKGCPEETE